MVNFPKSTEGVTKRFEADARQLVPVDDEIGGTVIYLNGRPAYYVLNGEWFQAVPNPQEFPRPSDADTDAADDSHLTSKGGWAGDSPTSQLLKAGSLSTS
jgi:hypothetical protein